MQDYIRTGTYQRAILENVSDFQDKIVLDVGAGSGILSFFAVQAGARKVYAVEASSMAQHAEVSNQGQREYVFVEKKSEGGFNSDLLNFENNISLYFCCSEIMTNLDWMFDFDNNVINVCNHFIIS